MKVLGLVANDRISEVCGGDKHLFQVLHQGVVALPVVIQNNSFSLASWGGVWVP
jgi:hypothetical protein